MHIVSKLASPALLGIVLSTLVIAPPATAEQNFTGRWIGPFPGPPGNCGNQSVQYLFQGSTFRYDVLSQICAGFWGTGTFEFDANQIHFYYERCGPDPRCPPNFSAVYRKHENNALALCDTSGKCYEYYQQ
jgi:hypothetical protein